MGEADAEPENVMTGVHTKKLSQQCGACDSEEDPDEDQESRLYEEIYEDLEDIVNEEPEGASEEEIRGESDDDPEDTIVELSEDDPEEEINEENDRALEDVAYEEPHENPEEDMDEEPEEESEEEIVEDLEDVPEEEIDEEPEEESEEEIIEDLEDKMIQNEENLSSKSNDTFATSKFDSKIGLLSVTVNDDCASRQQEPSTSSRKHRHSRWDVRAEEETPLIDETSKRRKTRWDNDDSRNFLFQVSSSLELSTDQEVLRLKKRLMEINKMLQSSEINGKENVEAISSPKPDNNDHGMKINARARRKLKKSQRKILSQLATLLSCRSPYRFTKKVFVPVGEYPTYKFIGLILGPKGNTQKRMEKETGAKIRLRGKGFGDEDGNGTPSEAEELHVLVEAYNQRALNAAVAMVEKLLIPMADENNEHKKSQLTELAKMRGTYKDQNTCQLCKEQGHRQYACPLKDSCFNAACCDTCGSFDHPTSKCKSNEKSNKEVSNSTLYVGYLSQVTDEKRLKELFLPFGKIIKAAVIKDPTTGLSKGYGFVEFDNSTDASAAVTYMNGYKMAGKVLAVRIAGQKPVPAPPPASIIYGQTTNIYGPEPSMFPGAQVSISSSESLYFPYSSGTVARTVGSIIPPYAATSTIYPRMNNNNFSSGEFVARTVGSTIPPYAATSTIYPRMNNNNFSSGEFSHQIASSFSSSAISQFHCNPDTSSRFKSYITSSQFNPYFTNPAMYDSNVQ